MMFKKKLQEWFTYFLDSGRDLSRDDFEVMMLYHTREYMKKMLEIAEADSQRLAHIEAMFSRLEEMVSRRVPQYPQVGGQIPAPRED
jgi:hypothetical protein